YVEVEVLRGVSLRVQAGHIVSIIGANGAGKSTLLRTVFGMVRPHAGSIVFAGKDVTGLPPTEILRIGIGYVPQGRCNFPAMSVQVFDTIVRINQQGTTVLMVEQNATKALGVSHRAFVLELGRNRFEGTGQDLLDDPDVRQHYLGG